MRTNPDRSNDMIRGHLRIRCRIMLRRSRRTMGEEAFQQAEDAAMAQEQNTFVENVSKPTSLKLRTRIHRRCDANADLEDTQGKSVDNKEDDFGGETCTICFGDLQEGDRVGYLSCSHTFHVECLKAWLSRRNVCPLCQRPDAAAPQFGTVDEER